MRKKGVNINLWSTLIFILVAAIMVLFGTTIREANINVQKQSQIEENRRMCERESQKLSDGSDYLTNEVYHYVATGEARHLENYWYEVNETKSRNSAIEHLTALSLTDEEYGLVERAKQASDSLITKEAWAMRLTADSAGMKTADMPAQVAAVQYTQGEERLSPKEKRAMASEYLFGSEYTATKEAIKNDIKSFRILLRERKNEELNEAVNRTGASLGVARNLMAVLIAAFLIEGVLFYGSILRPFYHYTRALRRMDGNGFTELTPMGAREVREFASVFNKIYLEWHKQKEHLEKERYRFHVALDNTSVIVYEYDAGTDTYMAFGNLEKNSGLSDHIQKERIIPNFLGQRATELMGSEGVRYFHDMLAGTGCTQVELLLSPAEGDSRRIWSRITGTPILDDNKNVSRIIGKITNIQAEKDKEFALEDARSRDGLTGLYKRETGIRMVRDFMAEKSQDVICGMMLVDMDDFTQINESEGQAFADAVLQDVSYIFRSLTESGDILIRLGGDEFMLFIKNCPKSRATILGPEIAEQIHGLSSQNKSGLTISASIGMCVTEVVDEYSGLYRCAESTLKYVKEHGKGKAACYLDTSNELGMMLTQMYPGHHPINKIDQAEGAWEDITTFALNLLGKSRNLDDALFLLLSRVGTMCGMDRILIIELDAEYLSCHVVYQWSRYPSYRQPESIRYITPKDLETITNAYDSEGLCEQRFITASESDMASILHAAIWNYGQCVGAMSFELRDPHQWTAEERQLLRDLTKIISSFTLKARADAVSRAKTDFLSHMSHEIRTPMNAITGMTIIAKAVPDNPSKTIDCLNKIETANKYLLSLINDVLDMSRIESGKVEINPTSSSIRKMMENLDTLIRPQTDGKGLTLVVKDNFDEERRVWADSLRINQVLVNLLGNAVKFTDPGGTITLRIEPIHLTDKEAVLRFSVTDTGIGISKEAQDRIFNAFEQADSDTASNYGGTGLGLAISSRLVQLMGGTLEVDSQPQKGSSFYFTLTLPYAPEENGDNLVSIDESEAAFDPTGKRLLLVEDNELNREIAQEILTMNGFEVEVAENGLEAVSLFEKSEPGYFEAILMDIRMPVMGGMEATRIIRTMGRQDSRTILIIAMTANAFDEDMKKSLDNGMNGHLSKPIDVDELLKTLKRLIATREAI